MHLQKTVDVPADVTLEVVPQSFPDVVVSLFLPAETVQGQALHRHSF